MALVEECNCIDGLGHTGKYQSKFLEAAEGWEFCLDHY